MTVLFLANIGSSDIQLTSGERLTPPREAGEQLLARWEDPTEDMTAHLSLPILVPGLHEALATQGKVDQLVLFATDQNDPQYRYTDTLHFAELAHRWLRGAPEFTDRLGEIHIDTLDGASPATYDSTFAAYAPRVAELASDQVTTCYVAVTGGTPAMNMALLFHAVRVFGERCQAIYKRPQPDEPAFPLDIGRQLRQSISRQAVIAALQRKDFAAALDLVETAGGYDADLVELTRYAKQRLYFDFDSARQSLSRAIAAGYRHPALRDLATSAIHDLDRLRARDLGARLIELTHNAAVAYNAQRYVSFLGRVYRFQEAVLRWVMEHICHLPTDLSKPQREQTLATWKAGIEAHRDLLDFLNRQETEKGKPLNYTIISVPTMTAVATFVGRKNRRADGSPYLDKSAKGRFTGAIRMLNKLSPLVDLRHRTIIAHDFEGVSAEILAKKYKGDPVRDLYDILEKFSVPVASNPFEDVAAKLIVEINRLT